MNTFFKELGRSVLATLVLAIVCCVLYPVVVWSAAQLLMRDKANGSLIVDKDGTVRGSRLLGQNFTGEKYFHPRPSSAGANGYDATSSSGSNLGPTSQKLNDAIRNRIAAYRKENGLKETDSVPADAVTASGSGLDPHVSIRNAEVQAGRVAGARRIPEEKVRGLIQTHTAARGGNVFGEPGVNVLLLNRALEQVAAEQLRTRP